MPMYNAGRFVREAVTSIQPQTYTHWELIIVDDGSTDNSIKIVKKLSKLDKRIKLYCNDKNLGIGSTMNHALKHARGNFIARMDADDIAFPERLEKQVNFLLENPHIGVVGSFMMEINDKKEVTAARKVPLLHQDISQSMMTTQTIQNPTNMINKKNIVRHQLRYDGRYSPVDDLDFWFRQLKQTQFANIPEYLMAYRKHGANSSLKDIKKTFWLTNKIRMKAILQYGYTTSAVQLLTHLMQTLIVACTPNKFLYELFKLWKGDRITKMHLHAVHTAPIQSRTIGLSLVMPVYRGGSFIKKNVEELLTFLAKQANIKTEVIIVVDGIVDASFVLLQQLETRYSNLHVYAYTDNKGKGYAVRFGLSKAKQEYVGYLDAGRDINFYSLKYMIGEITQHPDIDAFIADKKHMLSICEAIPMYRKIYSIGFNMLTNLLLNVQFSDTQVGLKIFRREAIQRIVSKLPIEINRFAFDVELLYELAKRGYRSLRCPVAINNDIRKSTVEPSDMVEMIWDVMRLFYHYGKQFVSQKASAIPSLQKQFRLDYRTSKIAGSTTR